MCNGKVVKVQNPKSFDRTPIVTVAVPLEFTDNVRGIDINLEATPFPDDMIVCRCEEVTVAEIKAAIKMGARDVNGVKRRTRAGMGLCQGRTCEKMVQQIIRQEIGESAEEIGYSTARSPVRPVTFASLGGELAKSHK
jgi:bacterioferritin-associated ferredoxin